MRKIIYSNEKKNNTLKSGIYMTIGIIIFLTIYQCYFVIKDGIKFNFSIYLIALFWFIIVIIAAILDNKYNNPIHELYVKQHEELLKYGNKCEGEILEITERLENTKDAYTYYTLKVKYFSEIYNEYKEVDTTSIKNISKKDIIGPSKKCIIYEKEDAIIRDTGEIYTGTNNSIDLLKLASPKNIKEALKVKTTRGYAFMVAEADIINNK